MTLLHFLATNTHALADSIASLLNVNMKAAFCLESQQKASLEYARDSNIDGLVEMINGLFNHSNLFIVAERYTPFENKSKRRELSRLI